MSAPAPNPSGSDATPEAQSQKNSSPGLGGSLRQALRDIIQPLRDFGSVPKQLNRGVNIPSFMEGLVYFGTITVMTKFLSENVALGDVTAGRMTGIFTGGITGAMFLLGGLSDRWGVRRALLFAVMFLLMGRVILSMGETLHLAPGLWGPLHLMTIAGMLFIIVGYGSFQPALYCAVKQYTTEKTSAMGYALLYGLQNFGCFASGLLSPQVRHVSEHALPPNGITGVLWVYSALTALCGLVVAVGLSRRAGSDKAAEAAAVARSLGAARKVVSSEEIRPLSARIRQWITEHPLWDARFSFFIFMVVPVQTLFAHGLLTMPLYIERAYRATPWVSRNFELFSNLNPLLIFLLTPIVAALTARISVYRMMIVGTTVMAAPTFLLALGPTPWALLLFSLFASIGEALWQPRFLQYIAEMAPPGKTGLYMGVGQFPWFLTKVFTGMYSGWFLKHYCPADGPQNTETMWLIYAFIAIVSPIGLLIFRRWASATPAKAKDAAAEASSSPSSP